MNSLNSDPNPALNPNKFKSYDMPSQFYQYYRLPNNANISPDFAPLTNPYGANQLLATQFSFQYSDNQGLGDGINANSHSNVWNAAPLNAALSSQSRNNQAQSIDPNSAHFFSIPPHGPPQATDQNLFYQYGYSAPNSMYWTHPSTMLEYKSTSQNYPLPQTDKSQSWSDALINSQYPSLSNSINYKTALSPIDQNNQILSINNTPANYQKHVAQNGYQVSQIDCNGSQLSARVLNENAHISSGERTSLGKPDNSVSQDKKFSVSSTSNNMNSQIDSLQSQLANDCSIHKESSDFDSNRTSTHNNNNSNNNNNNNTSQQNYSPKSLSKHRSSPTMKRGENSDFWSQDSSRGNNSTSTKSYANIVTKQSSRNSNCSNNISNPTSLTSSFYMNNGISGNSRSNYKSTMNGFATGGYSRPTTNNGNHNNWFNNSPTINGNGWNATKSKWSQDSNNRNNANSTTMDSNMKSSWAAKVSLTSAEENIRNAECRIKEIQAQINPKRLDINFERTRYFVIKSYSEDDVHRSIKYKIWCSTREGNKRLHEAFQNAQKIGGHVLLFFSVNGSGHFCGIAEMTSSVDESVITGVWCQEKWKGKFSVKWIYVKDVPNTQLRHISTKVDTPKSNSNCTTEIKPITNLRDATELKSDRGLGSSSSYKDDPGYQALRIIMDCKSSMSIFDDFLHYEKRELGMES